MGNVPWVGWDRHKLLWDGNGTDKYVSWTTLIFCLLWLISASADRIDYITNFCSMIKLLHEIKNSNC